jgi:Single-strand binding protein family
LHKWIGFVYNALLAPSFMPEQYSDFQEFDAAAVGQALGAEPRSTRDVAHGDGQAFDLTDAVLEVYPDAGVTRATTPDARVELFRVPRYTLREQRVIFELGDEEDRSRLQVRADGKVAFHPVLRSPEQPQTDGRTPTGSKDSPTPDGSSQTTTRPSGDGAPPEPREAVQEVPLRGHLGRDPWFATREDRPAAGFPLAVNPEGGGKATWHDVVTFDETAEQLHEAFDKQKITKGKLVEVTGIPVVVEQQRGDGRVRKTREFHATAVTRVQATRPGR